MTWELGWMRNPWLEGNRSVDFAPGVILYGEESFTPENPGALLAVGYNLGDVVSFTAQIEALQYPSTPLRMAGYAGARLGSYPAIAAAVVALTVAVIVIPPVTAAF